MEHKLKCKNEIGQRIKNKTIKKIREEIIILLNKTEMSR